MKKYLIGFALLMSYGVVVAQQKVDVLIKNAYVFDGSGADSVKQDIGIKGDRIVFLGNSSKSGVQAKQVIDATGNYVSPGFIDPHTHIERMFNSNSKDMRAAQIWLRQGVTTVLTGNDGYGVVNTGETFSQWEKNGIGLNVGMYVGFGSVRKAVIGSRDVQPTAEQTKKMQELVENAMKDGAIGFSTGLSYLPQRFSHTPEVVALAGAAAKYNGIYDTHMRAQSWPSSKAAIDEVLTIEKENKMKVHISHIKSSGNAAFGKSTNIIEILKKARKSGATIDASIYPYTASANGLTNLIPVWAREKGTKEMLRLFDNPASLSRIKAALESTLEKNENGKNYLLATRQKTPELDEINHKTVAEVAQMWNVEPADAVIKVLKLNPGMANISFGMDEKDVVNFIKQPFIVIGSDGSDSHPRGAGTFAKVISEYAIQQKILPLKEMIHKSTGLTAEIFRLKDRGLIKEGAYADVVIFNPKTYKANSTYNEPALMATGVQAVFVNGKLVIENDHYNGELRGRIIRFNKQ